MQLFEAFIFISGLAVGSFLNVLIDRLPAGKGIGGRSQCDFCGKQLTALNLIPVLSFVLQKARSACCNKRLSVYYPVVEIATGVAYLWLFTTYGPSLIHFVVLSALIVIFFADLKYRIIPDYMTVIVAVGGLLLAVSRGALPEHILAGVLLFSGMFALFTATKGRGMGFGDVKFAGAMGLLLGLKAGAGALYLAFVLGGIAGVILVLMARRSIKSAIAFGPFLVIGTAVMLFWGDVVMKRVMALF